MSGDEPELEGPKGFRSRFHAWKSVPQLLTGGAGIDLVTWDREEFDTLDEFDLPTAESFTARRSGYYFFHANITIVNVVANNDFQIEFRLNTIFQLRIANCRSLAGSKTLYLTEFCHLEAGDTVDVRVTLTQVAVAQTITATQPNTAFYGFRVS